MQTTQEDDVGHESSGVQAPEQAEARLEEWQYRATGFVFSEELKDNLLLIFGVILPVCAVAFEAGFHFCARYFFDPFPSTNHIVLFSLIPLSNLMAWMSRRSNLSMHFAFMSLSSGMAMGIALMYALMFLPLAGPAMFSLAYLGFGLLGLTPLLSLPCLWFTGKRVVHLADQKKTYFEAHQLKHFGHIVVLVMVLAVELPSTLTRMNLGLAVHPETEMQGLDWLRKYGNEEVLLRACYERSGRATDIVGSMYESHHPIKIEDARRVFYRVTGKPFNSVPIPASARSTIKNAGLANDPAGLNAVVQDEFDLDADVASEQVSGVVRGLKAHQSAMRFKMQPDALLANIDWSFHFGNSSKYDREARGKIMLPAGAVVTKATLTVAGVEHDATIMVREAARAVYQEAVKQHKEDPLLVSTCGPDQILVQCFPVHPDGDLKVDLHIVAPMVLGESDDRALVSLPTFVERNFQLDEKSLVEAASVGLLGADGSEKMQFSIVGAEPDKIVPLHTSAVPGADGTSALHTLAAKEAGRMPALPGSKTYRIANDQLAAFRAVIEAKRNEKCDLVSVEDRFGGAARSIQHKIGRALYPLPETLTVLVDGSVSMKGSLDNIVKGLRHLPKESKVQIVVLGDEPLRLLDRSANPGSKEFETALSALAKYKPAGGQDNSTSVMELASELKSNQKDAILWIHGPQPICAANSEALSSFLSLRTTPLLYDLQVASGPVELLSAVRNSAGFKHVDRTGSNEQDITLLSRSWRPDPQTEIGNASLRKIGVSDPAVLSSGDPVPQADTGLAQLLAYNRLLRDLQFPQLNGEDANSLAKNYHLITPISSAVVVDEIEELDRVSMPPPKPEIKPDPVMEAKDFLDHSFDHVDAFLAYTKYELIDRQLDPFLKQLHPGTMFAGKGSHSRGGVVEIEVLPNQVRKSFDNINSQLNRLNRVEPGTSQYGSNDQFDSTNSISSSSSGASSVGGAAGEPGVYTDAGGYSQESSSHGPATDGDSLAPQAPDANRYRTSMRGQIAQEARIGRPTLSSSSASFHRPTRYPASPPAPALGPAPQLVDQRIAHDEISVMDKKMSPTVRSEMKAMKEDAPQDASSMPGLLQERDSSNAGKLAPDAAPLRAKDIAEKAGVPVLPRRKTAAKAIISPAAIENGADDSVMSMKKPLGRLDEESADYGPSKAYEKGQKNISALMKNSRVGAKQKREAENIEVGTNTIPSQTEGNESEAITDSRQVEEQGAVVGYSHGFGRRAKARRFNRDNYMVARDFREAQRDAMSGTARVDSQRHRQEHQRASKALTMLSLIFAAITALVTLYNAPTKNSWAYTRSTLLLIALPCVFYVLGNFLIPILEQFFRGVY
ncbi:MAG: hypothetical protein K2X77_21385 [Candidatus Obscuribacterales bacterium]|nr:hypothetical protein [Candidatus Obscuribacterales bacterium]